MQKNRQESRQTPRSAETKKEHEPLLLHFFNFKKKSFTFNRKAFYLLFSLFFFSPFLVITAYFFLHFDTTKAALLFSSFFTLGVLGAFFLIRQLEKNISYLLTKLLEAKIERLQQRSTQDLEDENKRLKRHIDTLKASFETEVVELEEEMLSFRKKIEDLNAKLEEKKEHIRQAYLEYEDLRKEYEFLQEEFAESKRASEEELSQKEALQVEYQQTVVEQRAIIEKNKRYISKLEVKVNDLMGEIKNLLQIDAVKSENTAPGSKGPNSTGANSKASAKSQKREPSFATPGIEYLPLPEKNTTSPYDLALLLRKYVKKAENFLGANHLGSQENGRSRFLDISLDSFTLDLRRFFDYFRDETAGIIFIYSLAENKMLFANNFAKDLLGWSPEKFQKDFPHLLTSGANEWKKAIARIENTKEEEFRVLLRSKNGEEKHFRTLLALISNPPFTHHLIGIFAPLE